MSFVNFDPVHFLEVFGRIWAEDQGYGDCDIVVKVRKKSAPTQSEQEPVDEEVGA